MERGLTADQVLRALWRRKMLVGAVAASVFVVGAAVVAGLPSVYTATAVVRVEPQRPEPEMVQHTLSEQVEDRLLTVRQDLLSRTALARVIKKLNLYPETVSKTGIDGAVERMRRDLDVKVEGTNAYDVIYSASDPEVAAKVANRLPEIFADETGRLREAQAARATEFFDSEMKELKTSVSDWERNIAQFKVDHLGELPEQMEVNMHALDRITTALNTKSEELRAAEQRRSDLARAHYAADTEAGRLAAAEATASTQLTDARSQWTADHPEVQRLSREVEVLTAQRKDAEGQMVAERLERTRVNELITAIQKEIDELHQQADAFQRRLEASPKWAHQLAVMQSEYDMVKAKYQSVMSRKVEAELAQELEAKSAKSEFNLISPASASPTPAKPDRVSGLLIALLAALGAGVLTGALLEMRDDSVRTSHEITGRLPLPVLAVLPQFGGKAERRVLASSRNVVSSDSH